MILAGQSCREEMTGSSSLHPMMICQASFFSEKEGGTFFPHHPIIITLVGQSLPLHPLMILAGQFCREEEGEEFFPFTQWQYWWASLVQKMVHSIPQRQFCQYAPNFASCLTCRRDMKFKKYIYIYTEKEEGEKKSQPLRSVKIVFLVIITNFWSSYPMVQSTGQTHNTSRLLYRQGFKYNHVQDARTHTV